MSDSKKNGDGSGDSRDIDDKDDRGHDGVQKMSIGEGQALAQLESAFFTKEDPDAEAEKSKKKDNKRKEGNTGKKGKGFQEVSEIQKSFDDEIDEVIRRFKAAATDGNKTNEPEKRAEKKEKSLSSEAPGRSSSPENSAELDSEEDGMEKLALALSKAEEAYEKLPKVVEIDSSSSEENNGDNHRCPNNLRLVKNRPAHILESVWLRGNSMGNNVTGSNTDAVEEMTQDITVHSATDSDPELIANKQTEDMREACSSASRGVNADAVSEDSEGKGDKGQSSSVAVQFHDVSVSTSEQVDWQTITAQIMNPERRGDPPVVPFAPWRKTSPFLSKDSIRIEMLGKLVNWTELKDNEINRNAQSYIDFNDQYSEYKKKPMISIEIGRRIAVKYITQRMAELDKLTESACAMLYGNAEHLLCQIFFRIKFEADEMKTARKLILGDLKLRQNIYRKYANEIESTSEETINSLCFTNSMRKDSNFFYIEHGFFVYDMIMNIELLLEEQKEEKSEMVVEQPSTSD